MLGSKGTMRGEEERPRERRRLARIAFAVLGLVMLGHALLETARDTLFLERIDPARLPLAYIGIAVGAVAVGRGSAQLATRVGARRTLPATLFGGGLVTLGFMFGPRSPVALGFLYVWAGVFASAAVIQLWSRLGDLFDVGEAKQTFGFVAAGALVGASLGAGLSTLALELGAAPSLLVALAAAAFAGGALVALLLGGHEVSSAAASSAPEGAPSTPAERSYAWKLALGIGGGAALFTWVDLAFKTAVATEVEPGALGVFFAWTYFSLNLAAVGVQLFVLPRVLRSLGAPKAVKLLPALVFAGGAVLAVSGSLAAAAGLLIAQGTLRHGLFKTSCEILVMPLRDQIRARFKTLGEVAAQRGGQALAAAVGLLAFGLGADARGLGVLVAVGAVVWLVVMRDVGSGYLGLFRARLGSGGSSAAIPQLDLGALETLVEALSADDEREVLGALDWFEAYEKSHLVPALILFHPSAKVTLRALALFDAHPRADAARVAKRRLDDADPAVRAAALRLVARGEEGLARARVLASEDPSPLVRAEALAALVGSGELTREDACAGLSGMIEGAGEAGALATAKALERLPASEFGGLARLLAEQESPAVAEALAEALARSPHPAHAQALVRLLGLRASRSKARAALLAVGAAGEEALDAGLGDPDLPIPVRRQIPRVLGDFAESADSASRVAGRLARRLDEEKESRVASPILRALGRLRSRFPEADLDAEWVASGAEAAFERSVALLAAAEALGGPELSRGRALLVRLLREKSERALHDAFTWLHLARPRAGLLAVDEALAHPERRRRASARELLESVEPSELRRALVAFTGEGSARDRVDGAAPWLEPSEVLAQSLDLLDGRSGQEGELRLLEGLTALGSATLRALAERELGSERGAGRMPEPLRRRPKGPRATPEVAPAPVGGGS